MKGTIPKIKSFAVQMKIIHETTKTISLQLSITVPFNFIYSMILTGVKGIVYLSVHRQTSSCDKRPNATNVPKGQTS